MNPDRSKLEAEVYAHLLSGGQVSLRDVLAVVRTLLADLTDEQLRAHLPVARQAEMAGEACGPEPCDYCDWDPCRC